MSDTKLTLSVSEVFISIEGEAKYTGWPTVYIRTSGCNFTCAGFNNPTNLPLTNEVLGFNPSEYSSLAALPPITIGCDSIYAHDKRFSHLWTRYEIDELAQTVTDLIPDGAWIHPKTEQPYILSITGGEPTLQYKQIAALLKTPALKDLNMLLIETNCSVPLHPLLKDALHEWLDDAPWRKLIWSNSPKLSASGESAARAIKPEIALDQLSVDTYSGQVEQYFKFVCGDSDTDFEEVAAVLEAYANLTEVFNNVYIMPMSCVDDQQKNIAANVAARCVKAGYIYCHRVHLDVFQNTIGT